MVSPLGVCTRFLFSFPRRRFESKYETIRLRAALDELRFPAACVFVFLRAVATKGRTAYQEVHLMTGKAKAMVCNQKLKAWGTRTTGFPGELA